jgi:hypothetical protein
MADEIRKGSAETADKTTGGCVTKVQFRYWCEVCEKTVDEKRCPSCGLKTHKIR